MKLVKMTTKKGTTIQLPPYPWGESEIAWVAAKAVTSQTRFATENAIPKMATINASARRAMALADRDGFMAIYNQTNDFADFADEAITAIYQALNDKRKPLDIYIAACKTVAAQVWQHRVAATQESLEVLDENEKTFDDEIKSGNDYVERLIEYVNSGVDPDFNVWYYAKNDNYTATIRGVSAGKGISVGKIQRSRERAYRYVYRR